jgi:hypothetical protein
MAEYLPLHDDGRRSPDGVGDHHRWPARHRVRLRHRRPGSAAASTWLGVAAFDALRRQRHRLTAAASSAHRDRHRHRRLSSSRPPPGGTVATHTNGTNDFNVVGLALTTATAGNLVEVKLLR